MNLKKKENIQRMRNCHRGSPLPIRRFLCAAKRGDRGKEDIKKKKKIGKATHHRETNAREDQERDTITWRRGRGVGR